MNRTSGYIPFFRPSLNSDVFSVYYSLSKLRERVLCMRKVDFSRTEQVFLYGKYTERIFILCSLLLSVHEVLDYVCPSISVLSEDLGRKNRTTYYISRFPAALEALRGIKTKLNVHNYVFF